MKIVRVFSSFPLAHWTAVTPVRIVTLAFAVFATLTPARATTVIAPSFDRLVNQADYIVRAVVTSVKSETQVDGARSNIVTKVELDVREVIAGTPPQPLVLVMLGGKVGTEEVVVAGAPKFSVGDEDILFIRGNGRQFNPLVALMHGRYPILHNEAGGEYVARSNGTPLYHTQEVALPMGGVSAVKALAPSAQPLSPAEFVKQIHANLTPNRRPTLEN